MKKLRKLTLSFVSYRDIAELESSERIKKLLNIILNNRIIILQGKLQPEEEVRLIEDTMALVGNIKNFKGVELAVISQNGEGLTFMGKMKRGLARALVGDQDTLTIIGPASVVKEMKKDPRKIDLMLSK